ncbi:SpoIIE family protein phosphatase [Streptomyces sp. NPDC000609]|uniref:SpoIIE family protein phosphatase n=1 Tax=Streptomyces sp. NPDC000609 TaxID=3160957 RepID=UPI0033986618
MREVRVLDCGHRSLLVLGPHGTTEVETDPGLPCGRGDLLRRSPAVTTRTLDPGHLLVACSGGATEARNRDGTLYPHPNG